MQARGSIVVCLTIALAFLSAGSSFAAPPTEEDVAKVESFLFVQNTESGSFKDGRLTFDGHAPVIFFADRPYRVSGHTTLAHFIDTWMEGADSFAQDPPNAVLSILGEDVESFVVELSDPQLNSSGVSYAAKVEKGTVPAKFKEASLFIDNNLWAAVGGLAVGRASARRNEARTASAYQAGQQSAQQTAAKQDQQTYYQASTPPPPANPAPAPSSKPTTTSKSDSNSAMQQLEELKQMLDKGLITQDQYDKKSQEILAAM